MYLNKFELKPADYFLGLIPSAIKLNYDFYQKLFSESVVLKNGDLSKTTKYDYNVASYGSQYLVTKCVIKDTNTVTTNNYNVQKKIYYKYTCVDDKILDIVSNATLMTEVIYESAPKGVYKNRKVTTAGKGSGNLDLSNELHGGSDNIIIRLVGGILIHQGRNDVTQEGAYTQGCVAITAYQLHTDKKGQTDVDRNYQSFSEIVKNGANIDVIIK